MRPYLNVNLFASKDQFCVCNLDEYFLLPVLQKGKEPKRQMTYTLKGFLEYHKKKPFMERKPNDEITYFTGLVYNKWNLSIYDVQWKINVPHSEEMEDEQIDEIYDRIIDPLKELLNEMGIDYKILC